MKNYFYLLLIIFLTTSCNSDQKSNSINLAIEKSVDSLEVFAENIISTHLVERDFALSPNRKEIIFTLGDFKQKKRFLVHLKKENNSWTSPKVMSISGKHQDIEPFFSVDGNKLFFASNRPINKKSKRTDYNIWVSTKKDSVWGNPNVLDTIVNTKGNEFYPSVSANGNLYFTAVRKDGVGTEDIFVSKFLNGKYQKPEVLSDSINTKTYEFNSFINPTEDLLIFSSFGRKDGFGGGDLYYSKKDKHGNWHKAKNMGKKINSASLDFCPFYDAKTNTLYFTSERANKINQINTIKKLTDYTNSIKNGMGNIYRINLDLK